MNRQLDVLFVNPNSSASVYQELAKQHTAIEVPVWSLLLAQSCRTKGFGVAILDCDAERLSDIEATKRIKEINPRLVCFVVYGQNPNSGTTNMIGAVRLCNYLKASYPEYKTCFVGSHTSALPKEVLSIPSVDFVLLNEGVYALHNLLKTDLRDYLQDIKGIGWKFRYYAVAPNYDPKQVDIKWVFKPDYKDGLYDFETFINQPERIVPQNLMDIDLPGYAWDLLPYKDLYRSHFWHADFQQQYRQPAAALYTSLGCQFKCNFCMINILNRINNSDNISSADSATMRFWSPDFIIKEFDKLIEKGVNTIRISDEMFLLNKKYYEPLLKLLTERNLNDKLRFWIYSRCDTVNERFLELVRKAGVRWIALGIESANQGIRKEVTKGTYETVDVREVVKQIRDHDINVIANYLYGLPDDTHETMQETLNLSLELNTEMMNCYTTMALPGSPLYHTAKQNGWKLPNSYEGYSFHSYECQPLPTKHLSPEEVLRFRDDAWQKYFTRPEYLNMIEGKFGIEARNNIEEMTKIKLKRKILGD